MIEHKDHHATIHASGTGGHTHHRRILEHDGVKVAFWHCARGSEPTFHCPDDPDPWVLLTAKHAEAIVEQARRTTPSRDRCRYGHGKEYQTRNTQGSRVCLECRRLASLRARMRRSADRMAA